MQRRLILAFLLGVAALAASQTPRQPAPSAKTAGQSLLYRNPTFGFRYKVPYGWVDRTKEMTEESGERPAPPPASGVASSPNSKQTAGSAGTVLLAIFERPPEAAGDTINSAVVVAAEPAAAYPGLKKAEDYLGPLNELTAAKGFKPEGDPDVIEIDSRQLIRADYSKPLGPNAGGDQLTMHQSTLILLVKGQIVSFTFIAGTADEIDDLIENLGFAISRAK